MSQAFRELIQLNQNLKALKFDLALLRARRVLKNKYSPDQLRVPSGSPGGGQWTTGDDGSSDGGSSSPLGAVTSAVMTILGTAESFLQSILVAGGFTKEQLNMPVQDFVSSYCVGSIQREMPGQFLSSTIDMVKQLAKEGDAAAMKCLKLLKQDRFRK